MIRLPQNRSAFGRKVEAMGGIGFQELMIILVIVLIIFGPGKLPELGNTLGKTVRGFRKAMDEPEKKPAVPKDHAAPDASSGVKG